MLEVHVKSDLYASFRLHQADYHKYTYQPSIPDKHFNIGHWNYDRTRDTRDPIELLQGLCRSRLCRK